jgi:hypothetical protein
MTTQNPPPNGIDISRPNVARIYDYLLGGKDNFTVDREAAKQLLAVSPDMAGIVRDNRSFIGRVVRLLVDEGGIRQFLDLGGVVWINEWRPGPDFRSAGQPRSLRGGVGRKPSI